MAWVQMTLQSKKERKGTGKRKGKGSRIVYD